MIPEPIIAIILLVAFILLALALRWSWEARKIIRQIRHDRERNSHE